MKKQSNRKRSTPGAAGLLARIRFWAGEGSETLLAVGLVLIFFLIFTGILAASFPKGTGLRSLYGDLVRPHRSGGEIALAEKGRLFIARLSDKRRVVKDRAEHAVAWRTSWPGMPLSNNHAIQTLANSEASIRFEDQNELSLGSNSLVVLRQETAAYGWTAPRAALVVLGGEVRGRLPQPMDDTVPLEIHAAGAVARLESQGEGPAEFRVTADGTDAATLSIYSGSAEIRVGNETAVVGPDQALEIQAGEPLQRPRQIPRTPRILSPAEGQVHVFGTTPPEIRLRWDTVKTADRYRVRVARDPEMDDVLVDETVVTPVHRFASLTAGRYYWQVTGASGGIESAPSGTRSFQLKRDRSAPTLQVDLPVLTVNTDRLLIRGTTDPGARVMVGNSPVRPDRSGAFEYTLALRPGPNLVVVEAVDAHGNAAYFSEYVNAKITPTGDHR